MDADNVILTLLDDKEPLSVAGAMRLLCERGEGASEFIRCHLDDENPRIRKHVHQLSCILCRRAARRTFIANAKAHCMSFWEALKLLNVIIDMRYNVDLIQQLLESFDRKMFYPNPENPDSGLASTFSMQKVLSSYFSVGEVEDMFEFTNLLVTEIIGSSEPLNDLVEDEGGGAICFKGNALVLCELGRQLGLRHGWEGNIVMYQGSFLLWTPDEKALDPRDNWNEKKELSGQRLHICSNDEMIYTYLALLHSCAMQSRLIYFTHLVTSLMTELNGNTLESMPYPLGKSGAPKTPVIL